MPLIGRVLATVRTHDLIPAGTRVLAAVSGGADSVALALLLADLASRVPFTLAGIAHLHHGLRGADADADAAFVEALAARLGVRFVAGREDVAARAADRHESLETAARRVRYRFLEEAAAGLGATRIATGHTADDQAETLVMRLMRGAGLPGLSAIRPRNGLVIRPLLEIRRRDVETYLTSAGQAWREDASNADPAMARNRVRHEVMPVLRGVASDAVVDVLARTAGLIQDDNDELDRRAIEIAGRAVLSEDDGCRLETAALEAAGPSLSRRVIRMALERAGGGRFHALEHVEAVRSLIKEDSPSPLHLPGVIVSRDSRTILVAPFDAAAARAGASAVPGFETRLDVPGTAEVPTSGLVLSAELGALDAAALSRLGARHDAVAVQGIDTGSLTVRSRRPGDALRPLGAPGRRKLQDVLVDRKVARHERDRVPLVVDDRGRIVWVVGHTIADEFRVTAPGGRVLFLTVQRVGTP